MKKQFILTILFLCNCTNKPASTGSQVLMTPTASAIPNKTSHIGIYRITSVKNGKSIVYIPKLFINDGFGKIGYKRYEISADWKNIRADVQRYDLNYEEGIRENTDLVFNGKDDKKSHHIGTLSERKAVTFRSNKDCSLIEGVPEFDKDIFESQIPALGDELYMIPEIKNLDHHSLTPRFEARVMSFKLSAILSGTDNNRIVLTAKSNDLQNFFIHEDQRVNPKGTAVFSKKTNRIIGFLESYTRENAPNSDGTLNIGIISVLSEKMKTKTDLKSQANIPQAQKLIKSSLSKEWKDFYCSPNNVAKIISRVTYREEQSKQNQDRNQQQKGTSTRAGIEPPWDAGYRTYCSSPEYIMESLKKAVSRQDQAHAAAAAGSPKSEEAQTPPWDYIMSEHLPEICPRQVQEAIAARIKKDKEDKKCQNIQ